MSRLDTTAELSIDDLFVAGNYQNIIAKIAEPAKAEATIRLGKKMLSIRQSTDASIPGVIVRTTDGEEQRFDEVVVTTPLGWLKRNKDALEPLTPRLSKAIDSVSFGRLEKVFIQFPRAFWDESPMLPNGVGPLNDTDPAAVTFSSPTSFMHWLSPSYTPSTYPKSWRLESVSFAAFPPHLRRPLLLFYIFGDCSTYLTSLTQDLAPKARQDALDAFFEPYYSRLPNYDPKTCMPVAYLATEWCRDELAGYGSYCNFQVGMEDAASDVECMRYGMPEHHVWLAGEHTAPFDGLGTVAGAYTSGEAVAERIVQVYRDGCSRHGFHKDSQ